MAKVEYVKVNEEEVQKLLACSEGHFLDLKSKNIQPSKLSRTLAAFANAEGGELFIGMSEDKSRGIFIWDGFSNEEAANGHVQLFEQLFPLGPDSALAFLHSDVRNGLILKVEIPKSRAIKLASDGKVYIRRGAQNLPVDSNERMEVLRRDKGLSSFESEIINTDPNAITNSEVIIAFMLEVVPACEPEPWLRKQQVLVNDKPTVAGLLLFADEPQAMLPKRCGLKVYRYKSTDAEGTRDTLDFDPVSIEGCAYEQIKEAVDTTTDIIESVRIRTTEGLFSVAYPVEAIHEIITNAVLHRDYSTADDIHIKIFDNRVEILSPGTLPGHITPENILKERFARNGMIVRLINKFPNPPNKDVEEGLNTAFQAMRNMKLKDPIVSQDGGYVKVILKHEALASPEEMILEYLESHPQIVNRQAREITFIGSENKMKTILQRMVKQGLIELVPGTTRYNAAYRRGSQNT
ncbi:MAG: ATP-binding protein [Syntrophobacteraceae bacterium]